MSRWCLPEKWRWASAEDVAEIVGGGTPSTKNPANFIDNGIPWITPADLSDYQEVYISRGKRDLSKEGYESSGAQIIPRDSVLFTSRAPIGYCVLAANDISTNQGFKSLVLKGNINPKFIRYYLLASKDYAELLASGSTFKELSGKRIADLEIPIAPLNEQKRIAGKIEELQARSRRAREALEAVPDLLEQLRQSILAAAFRGDLTKEWRKKNPNVEPASELLKRISTERRKRWEETELKKLKAKGLNGERLEEEFAKRRTQYKEPIPSNTATLPSLPSRWCWTNWNQLSEWVTYGFTRPMPHVDEGPAIVTAKNIFGGAIYLLNSSRTELKAFQSLSEKDRPQPGDILLTKDGTIGRAAIVPSDGPPFCINQSVAVIWLRSCPIDRTYLLRSIETPMTQQHIKDHSKGMAIQHLSVTDFAKMPLPLPPIQEQEKIVRMMEEQLSVIERIRRSLKNQMGLLDHLNQSILFQAFRGGLAPQDPTDEPASLLLERIREEKAHRETEEKANLKQGGVHKRRLETTLLQFSLNCRRETSDVKQQEE